MPLPTGEPTTKDKAKAWAGVDDTVDDAVFVQLVAAVNAFVRGLPVAQRYDADPALPAWPGTIELGATMLAARLYRRRNTPGGVEVATGLGFAYVRRTDPDVAQLLELGDYAAPAVG